MTDQDSLIVTRPVGPWFNKVFNDEITNVFFEGEVERGNIFTQQVFMPKRRLADKNGFMPISEAEYNRRHIRRMRE